jgi:hypothetical protein
VPDGGGGGTSGGDGGACPANQNRCQCRTTVGKAINKFIDTFEDGDVRIQVVDERDGEWFKVGHEATNGKFTVEATSGGAPDSTKALHVVGTTPGAPPPTPASKCPAPPTPTLPWPTVGVPLGICYDAAAFDGISFWMKGDPTGGKNNTVKFSISTPPTVEQQYGGTCPDCDVGCYNTYATLITLTPTWTHYSFTWAMLKQGDWGAVAQKGIAPPGYQPQKQILNVSFSPNENTKGYDFWIDDVELGAGNGSSCADVVSEAMFNGFFPMKNPFYTYAGFAAAAKQWPLFCGEGSADVKKREAAAFLAHLVQETGGLVYLEEINRASIYCDPARTDFPCAAGKSYHGRGPMQLSWNYNYGTAGKALGLSLLSTPELVIANPTNAFNAGLWFWMSRQPLDSGHSVIVSGQGFGKTIQLVNGPLECGGVNPQAVTNRVNAFMDFARRLGVTDLGGPTGC